MVTEPSAGRRSVADCPRCRRLPHTLIASATGGGAPAVPAELDELATVIGLDGARLLRCPTCATVYYYSYDHQERDTCTMESTDITVRRYGPVAARQLLEDVVGGGAPPMTVGQFSRAFLDEDDAGAPVGPAAALAPARAALAELAATHDAVIADLMRVLGRARLPPWPIMLHAVETLCGHFATRDDWDGLRARLLRHADPAVRLAAAALITNIGVRNLSPFDALHTPRVLRVFLEAELAQPSRIAELAGVLRAIAGGTSGQTWTRAGATYARADRCAVARATLAVLAQGQRPA